jgi:DNA invertase Pin-like site-specific DNA recombinase
MEAVHGPQKKRAPWLAWSGGARAARMGCEIVKVYKDHGISGAKGRDQQPAFNSMCRAEERVRAGLARAKAAGTRLGRPSLPQAKEDAIRAALSQPGRPGIRKLAAPFGVDPSTVQRVSRSAATPA